MNTEGCNACPNRCLCQRRVGLGFLVHFQPFGAKIGVDNPCNLAVRSLKRARSSAAKAIVYSDCQTDATTQTVKDTQRSDAPGTTQGQRRNKSLVRKDFRKEACVEHAVLHLPPETVL
jgi:hypothetical protein